MEERRSDIRANFEEECTLHNGDSNYLAEVNNFSLGGALVQFQSAPPALHIGDRCKIRMGVGSLLEYSCEVIRLETNAIAVKFAEMHAYKSFVKKIRTGIKPGSL
jgi:hypothetical protein